MSAERTPFVRQRRWLTFSLRTLLITISSACVALGLWVTRAHRQRTIVAEIRSRGGRVDYCAIYDDTGRLPRSAPTTPWLCKYLAEDFVLPVKSVYCREVTPELVQRVCQLNELEELMLDHDYSATTADIKQIAGLSKLRLLIFNGQQTDDSGILQLKSLYRLNYLNFGGLHRGNISKRAVMELSQTIPEAEIKTQARYYYRGGIFQRQD